MRPHVTVMVIIVMVVVVIMVMVVVVVGSSTYRRIAGCKGSVCIQWGKGVGVSVGYTEVGTVSGYLVVFVGGLGGFRCWRCEVKRVAGMCTEVGT